MLLAATWPGIENFIGNALLPAFGSNVFLIGIFILLVFFVALQYWGVGFEATMVLTGAMIILLITTTSYLPIQIGYIFILILLFPLYWLLRSLVAPR